jgi:cadmium resistance protein CadD (predicted permease)
VWGQLGINAPLFCKLKYEAEIVALFVHCVVVQVLPAKGARDGTAPVVRGVWYRHWRVVFEILS